MVGKMRIKDAVLVLPKAYGKTGACSRREHDVVYEKYGQQYKLDAGVSGQRGSMDEASRRHQSGGVCLGSAL